jgi:hypothetical protein
MIVIAREPPKASINSGLITVFYFCKTPIFLRFCVPISIKVFLTGIFTSLFLPFSPVGVVELLSSSISSCIVSLELSSSNVGGITVGAILIFF